ncbi:phage major capsid protein [Paludibacter sp. 221]|uniref:phage major capsid protein n=1 Tax=Paludibacter sp. 221 TaxID=2302939 RepID=UPI0013D2D286|nr:phage major capsid protein [Paludibacter sp. 221]NDV46250.1 phage major capsid protein [Paludibacter sp. 221]
MEYKKIDVNGLEGKNLEFAQFYNSMVDDLQSKNATIRELEIKMNNLEEVKTRVDGLSDIETKMNSMKEAIKTLEQKAEEIIIDSMDEFDKEFKSFFETGEFKSLKNKGATASMEIKAPTTMLTSNVSAQAPLLASHMIDRTIHEAPREKNAIYNRVAKGAVSASVIVWANRINKEGGSAFIAESTIKPLLDWEYKQETANAKKVAASTKVSTEMLEDYDFMLSEIRKMMTEDLKEQIDIKLLTGAGGDEPVGMISIAGGYVSTGLDGTITLPNDADAIRAAVLQMRLLNFYPDMVFLNPTEVARIDLTKTSTGNYIKIEVEGVLRQLQIVETTRIDAGKYLLIDSSKWNVRPKNQVTLQAGWENDDFRKNLVTFICEQRIFDYWNSIDLGAFMYGDLSTIKAALEA